MNAEQSRVARTQSAPHLLRDPRLDCGGELWDLWGPYLSERAWGTVREDYSKDGAAWEYFPHNHARSRTYRWNEDGLGGISDDKGRLCFALALWNGQDSILKERLFGLTGNEGNHGEDCKECYFYLDNTPSHSWMRMLYKYPQGAYPYEALRAQSARRTKQDPEYELSDTGIFAENRYFDVFIEYAKAAPNDICIKIEVWNRGPQAAPLHLLPTVWFRNTWSWGCPDHKPVIAADAKGVMHLHHPVLGDYRLHADGPDELLFTENETNLKKLFGTPNPAPFVKDAFHECVVGGNKAAVNPARTGTKAAAHFTRMIPAGGCAVVRLRLAGAKAPTCDPADPFADFDAVHAARRAEADTFYRDLQPAGLSDEERAVHRQALAGMLWSKQFYHYVVAQWQDGDPGQPVPPPERKQGRNHAWRHLYNERVMSMPDKWEYPWYASWDLAFHCIPLALVDPQFAKAQLDLLLREWYLHPNGQIPAYEWAFGDVNPPVFAWAVWRVYQIEGKHHGRHDRRFLEGVFHKLLMNFTWWVNRKDADGNNVFQGGFLGLDNIGVFDRSAPLPTGGRLEQSDGTSWMAMFALNMMQIALELAKENPVYESIATKFFEHFLAISDAMNNLAGAGIGLWDEEDQFYYDVLMLPSGEKQRMKVRSLVGLIPLFAVETLEPELIDRMPGFKARLEWVLKNKPELAKQVSHLHTPGVGDRRLLSLSRGARLKRILGRMLDSDEFLSRFGIRSLSKYHDKNPFVFGLNGASNAVSYCPAESKFGMFGGNSNWRGPVWFPVNYLMIESLQKYHHFYGDSLTVECPTGSGIHMNLSQVADELSRRLSALFMPGADGRRPFNGGNAYFQTDPHWCDHILFHEYFHGDNGAGLGASHQTGWTGLVAKLIQQQGEWRRK